MGGHFRLRRKQEKAWRWKDRIVKCRFACGIVVIRVEGWQWNDHSAEALGICGLVA